jgi:hypothetical protein
LDSVASRRVPPKSRETQFDGLRCRDPLHAGRAEQRCGFAALNLGLQILAPDDGAPTVIPRVVQAIPEASNEERRRECAIVNSIAIRHAGSSLSWSGFRLLESCGGVAGLAAAPVSWRAQSMNKRSGRDEPGHHRGTASI